MVAARASVLPSIDRMHMQKIAATTPTTRLMPTTVGGGSSFCSGLSRIFLRGWVYDQHPNTLSIDSRTMTGTMRWATSDGQLKVNRHLTDVKNMSTRRRKMWTDRTHLQAVEDSRKPCLCTECSGRVLTSDQLHEWVARKHTNVFQKFYANRWAGGTDGRTF